MVPKFKKIKSTRPEDMVIKDSNEERLKNCGYFKCL